MLLLELVVIFEVLLDQMQQYVDELFVFGVDSLLFEVVHKQLPYEHFKNKKVLVQSGTGQFFVIVVMAVGHDNEVGESLQRLTDYEQDLQNYLEDLLFGEIRPDPFLVVQVLVLVFIEIEGLFVGF